MKIFVELEQKPQQFEDFCKQLVFRNKWVSPKEWSDLVDSITPADIGQMITDYWINHKPSVALVEPNSTNYHLTHDSLKHLDKFQGSSGINSMFSNFFGRK